MAVSYKQGQSRFDDIAYCRRDRQQRDYRLFEDATSDK
jgi:hypothetical protein